MAPEQYAVESAVRFFLHNWYCGLQPILKLETLSNGGVTIDMKVTIPAAVDQSENASRANQQQTKRRRSGKESRKRRQARRHPSRTPDTPILSTTEVPFQVSNKQDNVHDTKSDVTLSLPNPQGSTSLSPPSSFVGSSEPLSTQIINSAPDKIDTIFPMNTTPTQSNTTRTTLPSPTPFISIDDVKKIMDQISAHVGSSLEMEVSRILANNSAH